MFVFNLNIFKFTNCYEKHDKIKFDFDVFVADLTLFKLVFSL